jgi:hypothetical protein
MMGRPGGRSPRRLARLRVSHRGGHGRDVVLGAACEPVSVCAPAADDVLRTLAAENALLARELGRVQLRCSRWRDEAIAEAERLDVQLMRTRADVIVAVTRSAVLRDELHTLYRRVALALTGAGGEPACP